MAQLITPAELDLLLGAGAPVRVLDVRYRLDKPDGSAEHAAGHVPGAVYVDLESELSRHGAAQEGRHPLPDPADLQAAVRRWGVRTGDTVVVYDDARALGASRAWWVLTRSGIADVRLLDGGLRGWIDGGFALESGPVEPAPGDAVVHEIREPVLSIDTVAAFPSDGVLLDVRAAERYRGEVEPIDPIAGHIPGALNLPTTTYMDGERFRDAATLADLFAAVGVVPGVAAAAYCGSGVTAAQAVFAAELAGRELALYPGSWSQWSNTPGQPVATGSAPAEVTRTV